VIQATFSEPVDAGSLAGHVFVLRMATAGVPVTNNQALAIGTRLESRLPGLGMSSLGVFHLTSHGRIDPTAEPGRPDRGSGTYIRGSILPGGWVELFTIQWWGRNFLSEEGDNSYNSRGADRQYYKASRRYQEYGVARQVAIESGVTLDAEVRFHRFDNRRTKRPNALKSEQRPRRWCRNRSRP